MIKHVQSNYHNLIYVILINLFFHSVVAMLVPLEDVFLQDMK